MNKKNLIYGGFLILAILYTFILFSRIPENNFLFIGDQFYRFNLNETIANAFFIRKMANLSVFNAWQLTVQTPDVLYYSLVYSLGFNQIQAEQILFSLILFLTLSLSYLGFNKLSKLYIGYASVPALLAITFWYTVNPYLMVLWHGAVYNFGSSLTYSLAPLILYYFHISILKSKAWRERIICALLMFCGAFTFWMFAAFIVFLIIYTASLLIINRKYIGTIIFNILKLVAIFVPMIAIIIYPILHEYFNNKADTNGTFYATFGSITGGLWYQLLMYFSWGIYTLWHPRAIYPALVTDFFMSPIYKAATLSLYALLGFLAYKRLQISSFNKKEFVKSNSLLIIFFIAFFISIFLSKGKEPPLGGIFLWMYDHVPFFSVFRSSDHRFGFPAVLSLSLAFLVALKDYKNTKLFAGILIAITVIQNSIFITGDLLIGQNLDNKFYDRIVNISKPYQEVADYLNAQNDTFYILPNPSSEYGNFNFNSNEKHLGQDMISKITDKPVVEIQGITGQSIVVANTLRTAVEQDDPNLLSVFPIKYIMQRKDIECPDCLVFTAEKLTSLQKDYENEMFTLYKLPNYPPLINSGIQTTYRKINPVRYEVELKNLNETTMLNFMEGYNSYWKLYLLPYSQIDCEDKTAINDLTSECRYPQSIVNFSDAFVSRNVELRNRIFPEGLTHINSWNVSKADIQNQPSKYYTQNADGTYNVKLVIFYAPQSNYISAVLISLTSVIIALIVLLLPAGTFQKLRKNG